MANASSNTNARGRVRPAMKETKQCLSYHHATRGQSAALSPNAASTPGEALAMAKWLRENGVIADAISQHTFERIKETGVE